MAFQNPGKKAWWKKILVEKMAVERSGKKPGGKKAWCVLEKMEKKPCVGFPFRVAKMF